MPQTFDVERLEKRIPMTVAVHISGHEAALRRGDDVHGGRQFTRGARPEHPPLAAQRHAEY